MYRYLTLLACMTLTACGGNSFTVAPNERFTAAYQTDSGAVRVRYSTNGITWATADSFPLLRVTDEGPGLAATADGITYVAMGQEQINNTMRRWMSFSLGSDAYSDDVDKPLIPEVWTSAPAVASAGNNIWMIAFRSGAQIKLFRYDANAGDVAQGNPVEIDLNGDAFNLNVRGRPGLAILEDRLVLTFFSDPPGPAIGPGVRALSGNITATGVAFDSAVNVLTPSPQMPEIERIQDLSDDNSEFVLGTVFRDPSTGQPLQTHTLLVFESDDGITWSERTRMGAASPLGRSVRVIPMSIAALSDGTILAAFAARTGSGVPIREVFRFTGTEWNEFPGNNLFDLLPAGNREFALISGGQ